MTDWGEILSDTDIGTTPVKNNFTATVDPVATDDTNAGYAQGSLWVNTTSGEQFTCVDATASAAVWSSQTSTGKLLLVEKKTLLAATTTVSFTGLDGDADLIYVLEISILKNGAGTVNYEVRMNGSASDHSDNRIVSTTGGAVSGTTTLSWGLGGTTGASADGRHVGRMQINTDRSGGQEIQQIGQFSGKRASGQTQVVTAGTWNPAVSVNVTSLDIVASVASGLDTGSVFKLYKIAE